MRFLLMVFFCLAMGCQLFKKNNVKTQILNKEDFFSYVKGHWKKHSCNCYCIIASEDFVSTIKKHKEWLLGLSPKDITQILGEPSFVILEKNNNGKYFRYQIENYDENWCCEALKMYPSGFPGHYLKVDFDSDEKCVNITERAKPSY